MKPIFHLLTRPMAVVLAALLVHTRRASAAGCDVPMFNAGRLFAAAKSPWMAVTADLNSSVLQGNGDGTFQNQVGSGYLFLQPAGYVALGDFNHDGKLEAAASSAMGVIIILGNGVGTFRAGGSFGLGLLAASFNPMTGPISAGDLNGDGKLDLVVAFAPLGNFTEPGYVAVLLRNGDGNLDFASIRGTHRSVSVLPGKGDGTFRDQISYAAGTDSMGVAMGDLNADGKPDPVVVDDAGTAVRSLLNNHMPPANSSCAAIAPVSN